MNMEEVLRFLRGPLFYISLCVFIAGMFYRFVQVITLGWTRDKIRPKGSRWKGIIISYLKGIFIWPFIPWIKNIFRDNFVTFIAGGIFHLGLIVILIFGTPHMLVWKSLTGLSWKTIPLPIVDWFAAITIISMIILLINRYVHPVLKLISGVPEKLNWLIVFLPMLTGYLMTHHLFFSYQVNYSMHMLTVDLMLILIPFTRISHFMFYFFSRTIHGSQFGKRSVTP